MKSRTLFLVATSTFVFSLAACSKSDVPMPNKPALPSVPTPVPLITLPTTNEKDPPAKDSPSKDSLAKKPFKSLTKEEEAKAMPLPGQANDHSTPQIPAKPISPATK
jgi:hypothetical protein